MFVGKKKVWNLLIINTVERRFTMQSHCGIWNPQIPQAPHGMVLFYRGVKEKRKVASLSAEHICVTDPVYDECACQSDRVFVNIGMR